MEEDKDYGLAYTTLLGMFVVSTIHRQSSAMLWPCWYFETMVWLYDPITNTRGDIISQHDSGSGAKQALRNHFQICCDIMGGNGR